MSKIAVREKEKTVQIAEKKAPKKNATVAVTEMDVVDAGPTCVHYWVIASPDASPDGEMSTGKCKVCDAEKEFPNSADDYLWERSVPQSRWTGRSDAKSFSDGF